ncbi:MAG: L-2-hydroxyglutarate oxidase [Chloroflexota bacterium]
MPTPHPWESCQTLIIGAGITGLTIARELVARGQSDILILEKEPSLGRHASGRNSGVLHAGIYYVSDSLKARFCLEGNRLMKAYCREKGLTLKESGKVVVARRPEEVEGLRELKRRAEASGARVVLIDEKELASLEPHAATCGLALHSPETAVIRPQEVLAALGEELATSGKVELRLGVAFLGPEGEAGARTSAGVVRFRQLINAAGTYADRIAHQYGLGREYRILPFKGTYRRLSAERAFLVRGNIYPVPDLRSPFLGVHLTRSAEDEVYLGPTAIPAWGREHYGRLSGLSREAAGILWREALLFLQDPAFRRAAIAAPRWMLKAFVFADARRLVPELRWQDLEAADKVGIRAQLVHWPSKRLVSDFVLLREGTSLHVLNAVSPAFTSSMAFARHVVSLLLSL